ncbi:MAG: polysaccharide pyruvyl transferase CsaB [Armatimonadetes bacterium]|nr:polysaccharide pyruvyl transferase CsaB [Armatimonadota bacterium]
MRTRLVLAGYFGRGNLGDDAILLGFIEGIKGLAVDVTVIAGRPDAVFREYGLPAVSHLDFKSIHSAIESSQAVVFPGGSIFQDATSVRSVAYYSDIVRTAKKAGKKVVMLGQGVGPLTRFMGRRFAAGAFEAADAIAVRDAQSAAEMKELGVRAKPRVTADMAFLLPAPRKRRGQRQYGVGTMRSVGISARPPARDKGRHVVKVFSELLHMLFESGWVPSMIEMDREIDRPLLEKMNKAHGGKVPQIRGLTHPVQLQERLVRMDAVIGMRLHAGILATTVGVPAYMVSYDPKVNAFANAMGFSTPPNIQDVGASQIHDGFLSFIKDRDRLVASVERRRDELAKKAQENIEVLVSAVEL